LLVFGCADSTADGRKYSKELGAYSRGKHLSKKKSEKKHQLSKSKEDNFLGVYKRFSNDVYIHGPIAYEGRLVFKYKTLIEFCLIQILNGYLYDQ